MEVHLELTIFRSPGHFGRLIKEGQNGLCLHRQRWRRIFIGEWLIGNDVAITTAIGPLNSAT